MFGFQRTTKKDAASDRVPPELSTTDAREVSTGEMVPHDAVDGPEPVISASASDSDNNDPSPSQRSSNMRLNKNNAVKGDDDFPSADITPSFGAARPLATYGASDDSSSMRAVIGSKIIFKGELSGEEDLLIQGRVEGTVDLKGHNLIVGKQGVVKANLAAKTITIEGTVEGDLFAQERISIKASSDVTGNLVADRVTLEDGAKFRGTIDMESSKKSAASHDAGTSKANKTDKDKNQV